MFKSLLKISSSFKYLQNNSKSPSYLVFFKKASFATKYEIDRFTELRKLAKLVGTTYFKHNEEIDYTGDVRLIDTSNKLIGIYSVNEARKKCQELGVDLVLINPNIKPAICKAYDYKDELYKKFIKETLSKDINLFQKKKESAKDTKKIQLGAKMTIADLKNKVQSAQEIARKHKNIRVVMTVEEATEESGKNIILTFKDLTKDFLRAKGEIEERILVDEDQEDMEIDEDEATDKMLILEFESTRITETSTKANLSEEDLKKMVKDYIAREVKRERDQAEFMEANKDDPHVQELIEENRLETGEFDMEAELDRMEGHPATQEKQSEILARLRKQAKAENMNLQELEDELEEIKSKYGNQRDSSIVNHMLDRQYAKIQQYTKIAKLVDTILRK